MMLLLGALIWREGREVEIEKKGNGNVLPCTSLPQCPRNHDKFQALSRAWRQGAYMSRPIYWRFWGSVKLLART
jgi:hypothetical protein